MKVAELNNDKTKYQAKINIPEREIAELVNKELTKIAKTAKMDGFRVGGKVLVGIPKKKYASSIRADVAKLK